MTLYLPGVSPSEKYSPFLLVFRGYFWPLSILFQTTTPSATGLPCASLHTPFTVPEACAKTAGTQSPTASTANKTIAKYFFILASRPNPIFNNRIDNNPESKRHQLYFAA